MTFIMTIILAGGREGLGNREQEGGQRGRLEYYLTIAPGLARQICG